MVDIDINKLLEKRLNYAIGSNAGDQWAEEVLAEDSERAYLITPEMFLTSRSVKVRKIREKLLNKYNISGLFGLSNPIQGTAVKLILLVLDIHQTDNILSGEYSKGIYQGRSYRMGLAGELALMDLFPNDYKQYTSEIEAWLNGNETPADGEFYTFNDFPSQDLEYDKILPQNYSKSSYDLKSFLQKEKTKALEEIAEIFRPKSIRDGEKDKVISVHDFQYPYNYENTSLGWKTDTPIRKGDIICKNMMPDKLYLMADSVEKDVYAGTNDVVIRPLDIEAAAYIFMYLQSDTGKTIIKTKSTCVTISRLSLRDWKRIPVIVPSNDFNEYEKFFRLEYYPNKEITDFSSFLHKKTDVIKAETLEDILDTELVNRVKLHKSNTIRDFLKDDLQELNDCFRVKAYKATLILCGSILEAVLIDWISEKYKKDFFNEDFYVSNNRGGKKKANLYDYINTIDEIEKPNWMEEADKAHEIRKKRNLVHAKLCLKSDDINEVVCREVISYLEDVLITRGTMPIFNKPLNEDI